MKPRSPALVPLALLGAIVAISFAAIFFRQAMPTPPLVSAGIRLAIACAVLAPLALRAHLQGRVTRRLVRAASLAGLFYGLHFGAWVASLELTTVAASVTLVTATPLLLAVVALFTGKDRPERRIWFSLGLAALGISIIGGVDLGSSRQALVGDGLALVGMAAMAGYLLVARSLGDAMELWVFSAIATGVGALALLGTAAAMGTPIQAASQSALVALVLAALVPQLIGHNLLTWALRSTSPTVVGMATVGEPVGATLLGILVLGEVPGAATVLGCVITMAAVLLALGSRRNPSDGKLRSKGERE